MSSLLVKGKTADNEPAASISWLAGDLQPEHSGALIRLIKLLKAQTGFQLILLQYNDPYYRNRLIQYLSQNSDNTRHFILDAAQISDFAVLEDSLAKSCADQDVIHLIGLEPGFANDKELQWITGFNSHRELIAQRCPAPLLLWLPEYYIKAFALGAPDMWEWRSVVLDFAVERAPEVPPPGRQVDFGTTPYQERLRRIKEIEIFLAGQKEAPLPRQRAVLLVELGRIYQSLGQVDKALTSLGEALDIQRDMDDRRSQAITTGDIARIKVSKGEVEAALRLHEERLRVFEALGDQRSRAVTLGDIARIKVDKGEVEAALKLHEEQLRINRSLEDRVGIANAQWSIARIKLQQGDYEDAFERLFESYQILLEIGRLDSIIYVGIDLGQFFCAAGQTEKGIAILNRSLEGLKQLGREAEARELQATIAQHEAG
jgi:tetratricopeptide (TPR) repeat protein